MTTNAADNAFAAAFASAQRRKAKLTLRQPAAAPEPKVEAPQRAAPPPASEPARKPVARVLFTDEFARLSALVPAGSWPCTLPTVFTPPPAIRPMALGIGKRLEALLPASERKALHLALRLFTSSTPYLEALAADEAVRWSDDGERVVEPVSEEHRKTAGAALMVRAAKRKAQGL